MIRKQPVIRIETDIWTPLHGLGEDMRSQSSGKRGWNGFFEKEPDMRASSRARSFERGWEIEVATSFKKRRGIVAPAGLVEIDGEEEAGLVLKQRVSASDERLSLGVAT